MSTMSGGPNILNNGLILSLDAANTKSFRGEPTTNEIVQVTWDGDGENQIGLIKTSTLITEERLKYNGYETYLWTPGTSLNCYLNGIDLSNSRTSTVWTFSCYVKREDGAAITSLSVYMYYPNSDGSASGTIEFVGNGWYRISRTRTGTDNFISLIGFTGFASGIKYYLSGAQLEKKSYPTTFVTTNGTRGATVSTGGGWADRTSNAYHGELVNGPTYNSDNGGSLVFDGTNDYISTALTGVINTMTVECWFKGTTTSRNHLWNFGSYGDNSNLNFNFNDSGYDLWVYWESNGGNRVRYNIDGSFTDSTIKHVVFTHTGSTNKVYLNGVELTITESGGTQTFTAVNNSGYFGIGDFVPFKGNIYNVKVYNRALSNAEISQNYNAHKSRFGLT